MARQPRPRLPRRKSQNHFFLLLLPGFFLFGCSQHHASANVPPPPSPGTTAPGAPRQNPSQPGRQNGAPPNNTPSSNAPAVGNVEQGLASWYGVPYHGRRAANGEIYDMYKMTAAHRTLPFNTVVRVTNLTNNETVEVRINDRGPFVEDRIIDLSLAAARAIDMVAAGTARVRVEIISGSPNPVAGSFAVQVGAFADRANADRLRDQLATRFQPVLVDSFDGPKGRLYRLRVGSVPTEAAARQLAAKLHSEEGFETFVVRLDHDPVRGGSE